MNCPKCRNELRVSLLTPCTVFEEWRVDDKGEPEFIEEERCNTDEYTNAMCLECYEDLWHGSTYDVDEIIKAISNPVNKTIPIQEDMPQSVLDMAEEKWNGIEQEIINS